MSFVSTTNRALVLAEDDRKVLKEDLKEGAAEF
jgi:hypothetical protein